MARRNYYYINIRPFYCRQLIRGCLHALPLAGKICSAILNGVGTGNQAALPEESGPLVTDKSASDNGNVHSTPTLCPDP